MYIYIYLDNLFCNVTVKVALLLHDTKKQTQPVTYLGDSVVGLGFCWVTFLWASETDNVEMQSNDVVWLDKICERCCWRLIVVTVVFFFFFCKRNKGFYLAAFSSRKALLRCWQNVQSHIKRWFKPIRTNVFIFTWL